MKHDDDVMRPIRSPCAAPLAGTSPHPALLFHRPEAKFRNATRPQVEHRLALRFGHGRAIHNLALPIPPSAIRSVILGRKCHPRNQRVLQQAFTRNQRWTGHLVTVTAAGS